MFKIFLTSLLAGIVFNSCGQVSKKHKNNPLAIELNDKAVSLIESIGNQDSALKALALLDSATKIDSNCHVAFLNKIIVLNKLKFYHKAIETEKQLIRLKPEFAEYYFQTGCFSLKINDTISATRYFTKSLQIYENKLDTLNLDGDYKKTLLLGKGLTLIFLDQNAKATQTLSLLQNKESNDFWSQQANKYLNKNKSEVLELITNEQYSR